MKALSVHHTNSGLVFGGGVALLVDRRITLRGEYWRYNFGDSHFIAAPVAFNGAADASVKIEDINEVRFSLSFKIRR
jgi:hypothetical protein